MILTCKCFASGYFSPGSLSKSLAFSSLQVLTLSPGEGRGMGRIKKKLQ